ncbi:MAG: hypothetical protein ACLGH8_13365 [Bacteroidia bacterium]
MKKYNLEEQLANKLANRSITPTDNAWERIAFNRQQQAGKKQKKKRGLFMVAAVLLMLLTCGYFMGVVFNTENTPGKLPQMVQEDKAVKAVNADAMPTVYPKLDEVVVVARNEVKQLDQQIKVLAKTGKDIQIRSNKTGEMPVMMPSAEIKADEVAIKATAPLISESRTQEDVLLEKAMHDVAMEKQRKAATNDAALLKEVESEMDEYYREKALRFFSLKYKKIRIVVRDDR